MEVGEALVSFLDEKGMPSMVERALICPPHTQIGPVTPEQRRQLMANSIVAGVYDNVVDRESAYERLKGRAGAPSEPPAHAESQPTSPAPPPQGQPQPWYSNLPSLDSLGLGGGASRRGDSLATAMAKSAARTIGSSVGREIVRGVLGSLLGGSGGSTRRRYR